MAIDLHKLTRQHSADIQILGIRFKGLVVPQDLCSAGCGHGSHQQRIAQSRRRNLVLQFLPVPSATSRLAIPQVKLQQTFACWTACIGLVGPMHCRQFAGSFTGCEVDGLKDVFVELPCLITLKGQLQHQESIRQALHPEAHWPVPQIGTTCLFHRIVVSIDHLIQVFGDHLGHLVELLEVEGIAINEGRQCNGRKVADCHFVRRSVLNDLRTQVGAMNGAQVLLIGFAIAVILIQHVWGSRLHLGFQNPKPQVLSFHRFATFASSFQRLVEPFKVFTPQIHQTFARFRIEGFVGTEQGPVLIALHSLHEEVWDP
mmetsp:Transcript_49811/g.61169  ORF Transcript_49811/g.61169 Transcript_49811/m.61169 type:complete len:315 (-) Transcript_49811:806-1750(-)